ncbi:hypothetical protein ACFPL7_17880 [Dongia soli]|uniref:Uncharacterized protein n=1 Tax=Dongia soli TaxID=600628 RepID=A0ABU5E565_9PROT|nr:hypothetical protein [Dongia soli]MDY0881462.1 hypothetical protein [Dongia soli]
MTKLLIGASALALGVLGASGASGNPKNVFSDDNNTVVNSTAHAFGDVYSESYNGRNDGVSYQSLSATTVDLDLAGLAIPVFSGNAATGDVRDNSGAANVSTTSGTASIPHQAISGAAVGEVNLGQ